MNRYPPIHPGQRRDGKLELTRDDFAAIFESIDNDVHSRRSIRGESDLLRLSINELGNLLSDSSSFSEPMIPMHIAITHHRCVIAAGRITRRVRHWPGRSG